MQARLQQSGRAATLVNVLGAGGSGTTMLALMLGNSEQGFTPGETRAWYRPSQPAHFNFRCWCRSDECPVWQRIGGFPEDAVYRRARDELGAEVIADSSKWLDWVRDATEWALRDGIQVRNVLIWRDPVDLAHSSWRLGRLGRQNGGQLKGEALAARGIPDLRQRIVKYVQRIEQAGFDPIVVSYERLVDDPSAVLAALCDRLRVPYRPGQERFWEGEHHTLFGNQTAHRTIVAGDEAKLERPERSQEFERAASELIEAISSDDEIQGTVERLRGASL
jgi:hypothetical protein